MCIRDSPKTAGVLTLKLYGLKFEHVLGLGTFGTLNHLKFHRLFFGQRAKAFALDGAVMHKHIRTAFPGDKAKALGVIEPFYRTSFLHGETSYRSVSYTHLRAHETRHDLVCRLLLEKKKK